MLSAALCAVLVVMWALRNSKDPLDRILYHAVEAQVDAAEGISRDRTEVTATSACPGSAREDARRNSPARRWKQPAHDSGSSHLRKAPATSASPVSDIALRELDTSRKTAAADQRTEGDDHRAWLDRKYKLRAWKRRRCLFGLSTENPPDFHTLT
jgi:hypothetical protein